MAIVGTAVMVAAVTHKRRYFRAPKGLSVVSRIFLVSGVYFVPATVGWVFLAGLGFRALASLGLTLPSAVGAACVSLGTCVLGFLILGPELAEAGKAQPKW